MSIVMIFITVMITGAGCGVACGSLSTPLLIGKMLGEEKTVKDCIKSTLTFAIGKITMYVFLGALSSKCGNIIINILQDIYPDMGKILFKIVSIIFAVIIIINTLKNNKCSSCGNCSNKKILFEKGKNSSYFIIGLIYGIIPCSPLAIALTYAAGMNLFTSCMLMFFFGSANSIFSVIIYAPVVGKIISRMKEDLPGHYQWIQILAGIMIIVMSISYV